MLPCGSPRAAYVVVGLYRKNQPYAKHHVPVWRTGFTFLCLVRALTRQWHRSGCPASGPVFGAFASGSCPPVRARHLNQFLRTRAAVANLPARLLTAYCLRRGILTGMGAIGVPEPDREDFAGHKATSAQRGYVDPAPITFFQVHARVAALTFSSATTTHILVVAAACDSTTPICTDCPVALDAGRMHLDAAA